MTVNGAKQTLYLADGGGYLADAPTMSEFKLTTGQRVELIWSETIEPTQIFAPNLLGGSVEFDADISNTDCGCASALTVFKAPALSAGTYGDYYCDGNGVGGNYCPSIDILTANVFGAQTAPKYCSPPSPEGWYGWCE